MSCIATAYNSRDDPVPFNNPSTLLATCFNLVLYAVFFLQLSSRNADGKTPFMTSICSQNYAAALKILDYLEEWSINQQKQQLKGEGGKDSQLQYSVDTYPNACTHCTFALVQCTCILLITCSCPLGPITDISTHVK